MKIQQFAIQFNDSPQWYIITIQEVDYNDKGIDERQQGLYIDSLYPSPWKDNPPAHLKPVQLQMATPFDRSHNAAD